MDGCLFWDAKFLTSYCCPFVSRMMLGLSCHLHLNRLAISPSRFLSPSGPPKGLQLHRHFRTPPVSALLTPFSCHFPKALVTCRDYLSKELFNTNCQRYLVSLAPIAIAIGVSHKLCIGLEGEIQVAVLRSFSQTIILGFVLEFIFKEHVLWTFLGITVMLLLAGSTAGEQAKQLPHRQVVATAALAFGTLGSAGLLVFLGVFSAEPGFLVVVGHMLGNAMIMVGRTLKTLQYEISQHTGQIEAALALGAAPYCAVESHIQRAFNIGMAPMVDAMKVMGLVSLPGNMTGLLMGGAVPLEAVKMQIKMINAVLATAVISCLIATLIGWRMLFTSKAQLQDS